MAVPEEEPDDAIAISALQHYSYCPRQCALIHVEQAWDENVYTLRGQAVHEQVDTPESRAEGAVRVERALPLYSRRLGLVGRADVVEFLPDGTPFPIEYKHGPRRARQHDDLQVAAQAICLEEMLGRPVPRGAIFHHSSRRRREVAITAALRTTVEEMVPEIRALLAGGRLPPPVADGRCKECSLLDICQPALIAGGARLHVLRKTLYESDDDEDEPCATS
ncbi:MAG TPA: CRISPR-associated protein Cas4 [Candidatus Competibacter sp.]|nr:CRISPR-associated protein Cas4 [Candidatus Competibacteraceae bacterium]HPE71790.1 CRISPR-associated protein Cas4 [Candidatus Competibacter sp.]